MIFSAPVPFKEALDSRAVKTLLPTTGSSRQLMDLAPDIRERAVLSARVSNASILQKMDDLIGRVLTPEADTPGNHVDAGTFNIEIRKILASLGYANDPGLAGIGGAITDLASDNRLNLILNMNVQMAQGYGYDAQGQDADILDQWPAQELIRVQIPKGGIEAERDWPGRWADAGGKFYGDGRMIALKNDPIWTDISAFGLPYPPFDYNSGMDVQDIDRAEAEDLGVIEPDAPAPAPRENKLNDLLKLSVADLGAKFQEALAAGLPAGAAIKDGVVVFGEN